MLYLVSRLFYGSLTYTGSTSQKLFFLLDLHTWAIDKMDYMGRVTTHAINPPLTDIKGAPTDIYL